jgi:hypothetical protein
MDIGLQQSSISNHPAKMSTVKDLTAFFSKYPEDTLVFYSADMGGMPFSIHAPLTGDEFSYWPEACIYEDANGGLSWSEKELKAWGLPEEGRKFIGRRPVLYFSV